MAQRSQQSFGIHPHKIMVYLMIGGITALFLSFSFAYVYTRAQMGLVPLKLPVLFFVNTLVLLVASYVLVRAKKDYREDQTEAYKANLLSAIMLTILFLIGQTFAWYQLFSQQVTIDQNTGTAYLYLISGLHFAHVLAGLPFLVLFHRTAVRKMVEPVSVLLYFSDPEKKVKLDLLCVYWHFLDALWIYLVMFFAVNYLL